MTSPMFTLGFSFGMPISYPGGILFTNSQSSKREVGENVSNLITGVAGSQLSRNGTAGCGVGRRKIEIPLAVTAQLECASEFSARGRACGHIYRGRLL